jgi:hypothetical protein
MAHLSETDHLNGICILLKPNDSKLTVMFKFCIQELLTHLHRDACKNIVFCFTSARGTFYRPGDTLPALDSLLRQHNDVKIELNKDTIYCFDNEAVRFLAAVQQGVKFDEEQRKLFSTSLDASVRTSELLIKRTSDLEPHKVKKTLSLNDTRRIIIEMSRPLVEISGTMQSNIDLIRLRTSKTKSGGLPRVKKNY